MCQGCSLHKYTLEPLVHSPRHDSADISCVLRMLCTDLHSDSGGKRSTESSGFQLLLTAGASRVAGAIRLQLAGVLCSVSKDARSVTSPRAESDRRMSPHVAPSRRPATGAAHEREVLAACRSVSLFAFLSLASGFKWLAAFGTRNPTEYESTGGTSRKSTV